MAAPQLQEVSIKRHDQIILTFDQTLDTGVNVPVTCFSVNYGKIPVTKWEYDNTATIVLFIGATISTGDKIEVNYQPPDEVTQALRAPVKANASPTIVRRNVVRAFYKVPALNLLKQNEAEWNNMSNLGANNDGVRDTEGNEWEDGCGDVSGNGSSSGSEGYGNYPYKSKPNPRSATPDDFILAYGLREAIQVSNLDDADAIQPNTDKIWMAIQDACALIDNYILQASRAGALLISSNRRRTALTIARYYLDSVRRREDVKEDYERCLKELGTARTLEDVIRPDVPWWQDPCNPNRGNGVRSWRVPQTYNGVSGKGLSGWWSDSGAEEVDDWRYDRRNSERNNDDGNWRHHHQKDNDARRPQQPTDGGGTRYSGKTSS